MPTASICFSKCAVGRALTIIVFVCFTGCTESKVFLQSLDVTGAPFEPPLTTPYDPAKPGIRLIPHFSVPSARTIEGVVGEHTKVNDKGIYQIDTVGSGDSRYFRPSARNVYPYSGNNFRWQFPAYSLGVDAVFPLSDEVTFVTGLGYATADNNSFFTGNFGWSYSVIGKDLSARIAGGLQIYSLHYNAELVEETYFVTVDWYAETEVYFKSGNKGFVAPYVSLMASVQLPKAPLSLLFQFDFTSRTFLSTDVPDKQYSSSMNVVTLGISLDFSEHEKLIAGLRYASYSGIGNSSRNVVLTPTVRWELML